MTKADIDKSNCEYQYREMSMAKTIAEQYPNIARVDVEISIHFHTMVCNTEPEKHIYSLKPDRKIYLWEQCPNRDCSGTGFDLTHKLEESLSENKPVEGILHCNGKEDVKYMHCAGHSCDTLCEYRLTPVLKA